MISARPSRFSGIRTAYLLTGQGEGGEERKEGERDGGREGGRQGGATDDTVEVGGRWKRNISHSDDVIKVRSKTRPAGR